MKFLLAFLLLTTLVYAQELEGTVEVAIVDDLVQEKSRIEYYVLDDKGQRHKLKTDKHLEVGEKVKLKGRKKGEAFKVD